MKKLVLAAAIASGLTGVAATPAFAETTVSANIGLFSEYRFRGLGQNSGDDPAIQGGFDVDFGNGFYVGNWNSNVEFANASIEMDFYGGYAGEVSGVSYDVGVLYYYYPGQTNAVDVDTTELYGSLGYAGFSLGLAYTISDDFFGDKNEDGATYTTLGYEYGVNDSLTLFAQYGMSDFDVATDYDDYQIGATYSYGGYDFGLTYVDTDISNPTKDVNDDTVIFSMSTSF